MCLISFHLRMWIESLLHLSLNETLQPVSWINKFKKSIFFINCNFLENYREDIYWRKISRHCISNACGWINILSQNDSMLKIKISSGFDFDEKPEKEDLTMEIMSLILWEDLEHQNNYFGTIQNFFLINLSFLSI